MTLKLEHDYATCQESLHQVVNSYGRRLTFSHFYPGTILEYPETLYVRDGAGRLVAVRHNEVALPDGGIVKYEFESHATEDLGYVGRPGLMGSRLTKVFLPANNDTPFVEFKYDTLNSCRRSVIALSLIAGSLRVSAKRSTFFR